MSARFSVRYAARSVILLVLVAAPVTRSVAQNGGGAEKGESIHYSLRPGTTVYAEPYGSRPYVRLGFMEPVIVTATNGGWSTIRTQDGAQGHVESHLLSNAWIRVSKSQKRLYFYRGTDLVLDLAADFGFNAYSDKEIRGTTTNPDDWRTPEGSFFVVRKNPRSQFYKAFVLNYPNEEDAVRGLREGIITRRQYDAIVRAAEQLREPPMNTPLGGMIEIHGEGTGRSTNWTQGCVAVHNEGMDRLWQWVEVGTPVIIEK